MCSFHVATTATHRLPIFQRNKRRTVAISRDIFVYPKADGCIASLVYRPKLQPNKYVGRPPYSRAEMCYLYIIRGLSRWLRGVAWIYKRPPAAGARQAQAASGELRAEIDGSGGGGGAWLTRRAGTSKARRPNPPKSSQDGSLVMKIVHEVHNIKTCLTLQEVQTELITRATSA